MATDLNRERLLQETMNKDPNCRSFSWKLLRQAKVAVGAATYIGDTALTAPPFFDNAVRGGMILWGVRASGQQVIDWTGLSRDDQAATLPTLLNSNNWILLVLAGKTEPETSPLLIESSTKVLPQKERPSGRGNGGSRGTTS